MARQGLDGATIPRIARAAGVSPANVYRRFRDKDALLTAVFGRFSEAGEAAADRPPDEGTLRGVGLEGVVRGWIAALVASYRARTKLIRATMEYARRNASAPFIRRQVAAESRGFEGMAQVLLLFRDEIRHPEPERAVRWGMLTAGAVLKDRVLFDEAGLIQGLLPLTDEQLCEELVRTLLSHLRDRGSDPTG